MKQTFVLVLATLGLAACTETLDPRPDKRPVAASFDVTQQQDIPGTAAAVLGELAAGDLAALAPAATAAAPSPDASGGGVVVPNAYTDMMGERENTFPHGIPDMRYQQVFLGSELQGLTAIGGLCLRRDDLFGGPAETVQLTVKLGPTLLDNLTLTPVFDANYATPPTPVFSGAVNLPESSGGGTPGDFYICIDFTTTYTHPQGFNLIVEIANITPGVIVDHFDDACFGPVCTTRRVYAFSATATTGAVDQVGLVMKLNPVGNPSPSAKEDCKDGGWENFGFENQGQCVRFVETGEDSR
jgi:hypothetical protein